MYRVYRPYNDTLYYQDVRASDDYEAKLTAFMSDDGWLSNWKRKGKTKRTKIWARRLLFGVI